MTIKAKKSKINLREKLAELLNFRQIRDRLDGLGLYIGKDRTGTTENLAVRGGANVDDLQLAEISAALGGTAIDVFVYDTRNDSDGGKWRERTSHTSWYNEELNTATRGGRREFPAVAVIVAESDKVTIYDGDDPDLSMWMVFDCATNNKAIRTTPSAIYALNSVMYVSTNGITNALPWLNFISDTSNLIATTGIHNNDSIANRNNRQSWAVTSSSPAIVNNNCNDVAMTVLPNAPIDENTGLPVPTIAVATDGGVSVIRDDGSVESNGNFGKIQKVTIDNKHNLYIFRDMVEDYVVSYGFVENKISNFTTEIGVYSFRNGRFHTSLTTNQFNLNSTRSDVVSGQDYGLLKVDTMAGNFDEELFSYITSEYNTGWMPGDIKLATLSDNTVETVGEDETTELLVDGSGNWIGDFNVAADLDSWTESNGGIKSLNGSVIKVISGTSGDRGSVWSMIDTIPGKKYSISAQLVTVAGNGSGFISIYEGNGISGSEITTTYPNTFASGSYIYLQFTAQSEQSTIRLSGSEVLNDFTEWDNVSIKQTGELITNGTFDSGTVGWIYDDNGTSSQSVSGGVLTLSHTTYTNSMLYQILDLMPGKKYVLTGQTGGTNFDLCNIRIGSSLGGNQFGNIVSSEATSSNLIDNVITFTPTQSTTYISLRINSSSPDLSCDFDNISVRLAEDDRSVNDNGLQVFGQIDKTPVAPGADLVAYSGFSPDDYLMQPYNSDLDFGTGDFYMSIWAYGGGTNQALMTREHSTGDSDGSILLFQYDNKYSFYCRQDGSNEWTSSDSSVTYGSIWNHIMMVRTGGILYGYVNGKLETSIAFSGNLTNNDATIHIARRSPKSSGSLNIQYFTGSLALAKIGATAPTPEQIAKIYRDEKVLFQDGAQATLYGTSDAVTALAYDDKTELLHVGTSSGRSDFSGLRRINNTTTAVTTSISASNNLIAEQ